MNAASALMEAQLQVHHAMDRTSPRAGAGLGTNWPELHRNAVVRLNGHKLEQTSGDSEGQRSLACMLLFMGSQRVRRDLLTEQQSYIPASSLL